MSRPQKRRGEMGVGAEPGWGRESVGGPPGFFLLSLPKSLVFASKIPLLFLSISMAPAWSRPLGCSLRLVPSSPPWTPGGHACPVYVSKPQPEGPFIKLNQIISLGRLVAPWLSLCLWLRS